MWQLFITALHKWGCSTFLNIDTYMACWGGHASKQPFKMRGAEAAASEVAVKIEGTEEPTYQIAGSKRLRSHLSDCSSDQTFIHGEFWEVRPPG